MKDAYKTWMSRVRTSLEHSGLIRPETKLTDDFFKVYYDAGYSPAEAIKEDFGDFEFPWYSQKLNQ